LIESTREGHFKITPRGRRVLASHPARIDNAFLDQFEEFKQFRKKSAQGADEVQPSTSTTTFESQTVSGGSQAAGTVTEIASAPMPVSTAVRRTPDGIRLR